MPKARGYAALDPKSPLAPFTFDRREPGSHDVEIEILFCGICHSDLHQARDEWGGAIFPMVPGHEIVGRVTRVGAGVTRFGVGEMAGVGCMVDSCRGCRSCEAGLEQYCLTGSTYTYNALERDGKTPTFGGYSSSIVVDEAFVLRVPASLPPDAAAPLLCAGITTYSPLRHWKVGAGQKVGVNGLGGLGHMGVKLAAAFGADVTVLSTSPRKQADAKRLGASGFLVSSDAAAMEAQKGSFDFILDTVSAVHDLGALLALLRSDGKLVLVGAPPEPLPVSAFSLIPGRKTMAGSLIGGIAETQEMLDFCAEKKVLPDIEVIPMAKVNEAWERMLKGDVRYRFVIDLKTL